MRVSYRAHGGSQDYWQHRWDGVAVDSGAINLKRYPGRHAEQVIVADRPSGPVLEAGCGAGRLLRHYHDLGIAIVGLDFISTVLSAIHGEDPSIPLAAGDVTALPFPDESFSAVLAFGLYHGLETGLEAAIADTRRVIKPGGLLCASMRLNNLQNRVTDSMANRKVRRGGKAAAQAFHKLNLTIAEFKSLVGNGGFQIETIDYVENMSFLFKFPLLRHASQRIFRESEVRSAGCLFNLTGNILQRTAMALVPAQMANLAVITARAV